MAPPSFDRPLSKEPTCPALHGRRPAFLVDASSGLELRILRAWIGRHAPASDEAGCDALPILATRRRRRAPDLSRLDALLASGADPLLIPVRVAWLPRKRNGKRRVRLSDLLTLSDPRDPDALRQRWILWREPDRCRIVLGDPAPARDLRERWRHADGNGSAETTGLAVFVARQAGLALERAERRLRGARYKVPRLLREDILAHPAFRGGLAALARELGRDEYAVSREAARDLREIAATHSPFVIDVVAHGIRLLYSQGYGKQLLYDHDRLHEIAQLSQKHPVVFLPSHKSNLDHLVLQYALHENGHPPNHTAGGINMNFFPVGPLVRRSGVFFIRRQFRDDAVYKFVLRHYIDYLIEKRFSLEWYIEGGRSRSGKLLPPRFGLLAYVAGAFQRGKSDEVVLIPTSLAYDQISDVGSYAAEQGGAEKKPESFGWFLGVIRSMRRRYGNIHIRFGEPIFLSKAMLRSGEGAETDPDERDLAVQKLAFQVAVRINRVTPITPTSLVAMALLGCGDRALTWDEIAHELENLLFFIRRRNLPSTGEFGLYDPEDARFALGNLIENGVVSEHRDGPEPVYRIRPEKQLDAAYYRNTIIHFFVSSAIAELALLRAAEEGGDDAKEAFFEAALALRDLLKFEFFFSEKVEFREELRQDLTVHKAQWKRHFADGPEGVRELLRAFRPFNAHRVLRPFLEAYGLVGDYLERWDVNRPVEVGPFVRECIGLGRQYHLQHRIRSASSVSQVLIRTALDLAANRGLLDLDTPDLSAARKTFAAEVRDAIRRIDAIETLAASRRVGLIE